ncbi:LysE family transporter [Candidatus Peregrinibacteria bacterium]|nr:MAG: LysE family transporter [Candidatus Peregrinibacteria bacterium]
MLFPEAFLFGLSQGFIIGPITLYGIREGLNPRRGFFFQAQVILGATLVDACYLMLGTTGAAQFIQIPWVQTLMWCLAAYMLTSMGYHSLNDHTHKRSLQHMHRHKLRFFDSDFIKGGLMCLVNPMAIVFSLVVVGSLYSAHAHEISPYGFSANVALGGVLASFGIAGLTFIVRHIFHQWMLKKLMRVGSYILIAYGLKFTFKAVLGVQPLIIGLIS